MVCPNLGQLIPPARELAHQRVRARGGTHASLFALYRGDDVGEGVIKFGEGLPEDVGISNGFQSKGSALTTSWRADRRGCVRGRISGNRR